MSKLSAAELDQLHAAAFRRLITHLDSRKDVQNIDLMILAGFCRNCLSKWLVSEADNLGIELSKEEAQEQVYGMTYQQWKCDHQTEATPEQLAALNKVHPH